MSSSPEVRHALSAFAEQGATWTESRGGARRQASFGWRGRGHPVPAGPADVVRRGGQLRRAACLERSGTATSPAEEPACRDRERNEFHSEGNDLHSGGHW